MFFKSLILSVVIVMMVGCGMQPQKPIEMSVSNLFDQSSTVAVVFDPMPQPSLEVPGAGCLLCVAVARGANSQLTRQVETFSIQDLVALKADIADKLTEQGKSVRVINEEFKLDELPKAKVAKGEDDKARLDHSSIASEYNVDQLLVVDINSIGVIRNYSSYIPVEDPKASIMGRAYLVDLKTNTYLWYLPISSFRFASGEWKEPPEYPGITNAYYQLVEELRDNILSVIEK